MKNVFKKFLSGVLIGSLALGTAISGSTVTNAATNKALRLPISFTSATEDESYWDVASAYAETSFDTTVTGSTEYTLSYKVYIPKSVIDNNEGSILNFSEWITLTDTDAHVVTRQIMLHVDGDSLSVTGTNEETETDVDVSSYASVKAWGDYYLLTVKNLPLQSTFEDGEEIDTTKNYDCSFAIYVDAVNVKSSLFMYIDNVTLKGGSTTLATCDFSSVSKKNTSYTQNGTEIGTAYIDTYTKKLLTVSSTTLSVKKGKKKTITATAAASSKITYKSSNSKIAKVSSKGVVTGKKAGTATITVKANGVTKRVKVTVK